MGFLIRRNLPLAWAGWYDTFDRPPESPPQQPWAKWGNSGLNHEINSLQELHIASAPFPDNFGGMSYEFEPYTQDYGFEAEVWFPVSGLLTAQWIDLYLMANWAKNFRGVYSQATAIMVSSQPAIDGHTMKIREYSSVGLSWRDVASGPTPTSLSGNYFTWKVWVDGDSLVRVYMNDTLVCQGMLNGSYRTGPGKRGLNLWCCRCDSWYRWIKWYDRPTDFPDSLPFTTQSYDDFTAPDGDATALSARGWTTFGSDQGIRNNTYSTTGTTNGNRAILKNTGITNGAQRVEGVIGGNINPNPDVHSGLILRGNSAGTAGLMAKFESNSVQISRFTSSLSGGSITYADGPINTTGISIGSGATCAFECNGNYAWAEVNGVKVCQAQVNTTALPTTNSWCGAHVQRSGSDSASWNDLRIMEFV